MNLKSLLIGLEGLKAKGNLDIDIKGIACNSKEVKEGYLFVAIKGFETDGHIYIEEALKNGAIAILIEEGCDLKSFKVTSATTVIMAKDTREALAIISNNYYDNLHFYGIANTTWNDSLHIFDKNNARQYNGQ